jgi:hypothetical protein
MQAGIRPYKCQFLECGKAFFKRKHMKQHEKTHEKIATHLTEQHKCQFLGCEKGFSSRSKLHRHEMIHQRRVISVDYQEVKQNSTNELAGIHLMMPQPFVNENSGNVQEVMSSEELTYKKESV